MNTIELYVFVVGTEKPADTLKAATLEQLKTLILNKYPVKTKGFNKTIKFCWDKHGLNLLTFKEMFNSNTRTNARKLTAYLKTKGLPAIAPRKKSSCGRWDVSLTVNKGSLGKKHFTVVNGVAVAA